jgi:hypothetical protein
MSNITKGQTVTIGATAWRVLAIEHGEALLLRDLIVDYRAFHGTPQPVTWQTSDLRQWLNGEYFRSLPAVLKELALPVDVSDGISTASDTERDRVFLLSADEARAYFPSDDSRRALGRIGKASWWWLRSPGYHQHYAANVSRSGYVYGNGTCVSHDGGGVRPALWVNLESLDRVLETPALNRAIDDASDSDQLLDVLARLDGLSAQVTELSAQVTTRLDALLAVLERSGA